MKKVYIFTVSDLCSGGPEALHQLAYYLRRCGFDAYTVYYQPGSYHYVDSQPISRYQQYGVNVVRLSEIEDKKGNICIAPESAPWCLNNVRYAKKVIWWLGVAANRFEYPSFKQSIIYGKRRVFRQSVEHLKKVLFNDKKVLHLCGSEFAYEYVTRKYPRADVRFFVEPISLDYLRADRNKISVHRAGVIYNPAKPSERMQTLLTREKFKFIPLKGYTPMQLIDIYRDAALYVDFGEFGGPERIPKEAVYFGCPILVANHNAAQNDFDVAIPRGYKLSDDMPIDDVEDKILYMISHYDEVWPDFIPFQNKIINLESNFKKQILEVL